MLGKGRLKLSGSANTAVVTVNTAEEVILSGDIKKVIVTNAKTLKVEEGTKVETLEVNKDVTMKGSATIENVTGSSSLTAGEDIIVEKNESKADTSTVSNATQLQSALKNSEITEIKVNGTIGSQEEYVQFNITRAVSIKGLEGNKVYGTFVIETTGVTLDYLNIFVKGDVKGASTLARNGIYILTNESTITNNVFTSGDENAAIVNGLSIWSQTEGDTKFDISGNGFNFFKGTSDSWSSSAILVVEGLDMGRFDKSGTVAKKINVNDEVISTGNNYEGSTIVYNHQSYFADDSKGIKFGYALTSGNLGLMLRDASKGGTILLGNDITRNGDINVTKNITLKGKHKVTVEEGSKITVAEEATLTVEEGTTIEGIVEGTVDGAGTWIGKELDRISH